MTEREASDAAFGGSIDVLHAAEHRAMRLVREWLGWFRDQGYGTPGVCRMDFLVELPPGCTQARLWTLGLGACGSCMCGLSQEARSAAVLNEALAMTGGDHAMRFPVALPSLAPQTATEQNVLCTTTHRRRPRRTDRTRATPRRRAPAASRGVRLFAVVMAITLALLVIRLLRRLHRRLAGALRATLGARR